MIRQLPPDVVNKIAAGEVIERPASVVKELLENAVDAGATRIDVTVEKGGTELIRIRDDGCGIPVDQMELAIASHATSKISNADDLFQVSTLGFRGEALASIAAVSRFVIRSRTRDAAGAELDVNGGQFDQVMPCGCPPGTTIEVRDLFFNTPVRRKFLRTKQTEMGHVTEAFTRIALAHPAIQFTLSHNDHTIHELVSVESWRDRITALFGAELVESLIHVESADDAVQLHGYVADPTQSRSNAKMQYVLLNGRHIRDRSLQHALGEAYRGLLLTGRYPIAFLRLALPAELVDVNVHPAKLEVRFQDGGRLYSQLLSTIRQRFLSTDLTARVQSPQPVAGPAASGADPVHTDHHRRQLDEWATGQPSHPSSPADSGPSPRPFGDDNPLRLHRSVESPQTRLDFGAAPPQHTTESPSWRPAPDPAVESHVRSTAPAALQIRNRYLVTEDAEGVVIIDQHALHERILYEQLRERVLAGRMETQALLVPEPVSLTAAEAAMALESTELLAQLGITIEPFGGDTVLVSAYPAMLANLGPGEMLRQVIEQLMSDGKPPERRDLLDDLLHMISCKAAIKAGDRLSSEEIVTLLEHRDLCQDSHHCPHGRPTALVFTQEELDRRFLRT